MSVSFSVVAPLSYNRYLPPLLYQSAVHLDASFIPPYHQPSLLVSAPRAACMCLPPFPFCASPPFAALGLLSGPCHPLGGGFSVAGPSAYLCPCLILLVDPPSPGIIYFWLPCRVDVRVRERSQGASTPCHLPALVLATPRYLAMPAPFRLPRPPPFPPLPPLLVVLIPSSLVEIVGRSARRARILQS